MSRFVLGIQVLQKVQMVLYHLEDLQVLEDLDHLANQEIRMLLEDLMVQ